MLTHIARVGLFRPNGDTPNPVEVRPFGEIIDLSIVDISRLPVRKIVRGEVANRGIDGPGLHGSSPSRRSMPGGPRFFEVWRKKRTSPGEKPDEVQTAVASTFDVRPARSLRRQGQNLPHAWASTPIRGHTLGVDILPASPLRLKLSQRSRRSSRSSNPFGWTGSILSGRSGPRVCPIRKAPLMVTMLDKRPTSPEIRVKQPLGALVCLEGQCLRCSAWLAKGKTFRPFDSTPNQGRTVGSPDQRLSALG